MGKRAPISAYLGWLSEAMAPAAPQPKVGGGRDLILGYATGYDAADIAPFVRSMRSVFDGEAALVVDVDRPDVTALLAEHDVQAVAPRAETGWTPHPVMERFAAFDRLLAERPGVGNVLITDVRDVVFQGAPFAPAPQTLEFFVEADTPLKTHAFNMKHLRAVFGSDFADRLGEEPCVCVGTVMGPGEAMVRFCRLVLLLAAAPRSEAGGAFGADQAACNLAVHLGLVEREIRPNYGRVATLGLSPGEALSVRDGLIVNPDGSASPIVHQHDRHPHLMSAVHDRWAQGLEKRERVRPRGLGERFRKLQASFRRRTPELR